MQIRTPVREAGVRLEAGGLRAVCVFALAAALAAPGAAIAQTVPEAIEMALQTNPALAAQRAQLQATGERRVQAGSIRRATLSGEASYGAQAGWSRGRTGGGGITGEERSDTQPGTIAVTASQPIWLAGRAEAAMGEADARVEQARSRLEAAQIGVIQGVITGYADLARDARAVEIRRANAATLTRQLESAQARFEVGEITRTDVAQVEARLAGARASLSGAEARLGASRSAIERLIGQPPTSLTPGITEPRLPASLEQALLMARASNPDLAAARAAADIASAGARFVEADTRPRAVLAATGSRSVDQGFDGNTGGGIGLQARVTVPLYTGGANASRVREASGLATAARLAADDAGRAVDERVANAWRQLDAARLSRTATLQQVNAARIAFEGAELEQSVGLRTTLDVLIQQQELLEAELAAANAERDVLAASYGLSAAVGSLNPESVGASVPPAPPPAKTDALLPERPLIAVQQVLDGLTPQ
jgi:outer membrane protein